MHAYQTCVNTTSRNLWNLVKSGTSLEEAARQYQIDSKRARALVAKESRILRPVIEAISSASAWMVRVDGTVFPVFMHPFGDADSDAVEDAAWLACTDNLSVADEDRAIKYIAAQFIQDFGIENTDDVKTCFQDVHDTLSEIECLKTLPKASLFVHKCEKYLQDCSDNLLEILQDIDTKKDCDYFKSILNNQFIRVRYGSEYLTQIEKPGALYFRVSSTHVDWYEVIMNFCIAFDRKIATVTIESDHASTGKRVVYADHVPWNEFLLNKKICIEALSKYVRRKA